ncbi:MAG: biosynthetic arginine decarboxylase [Chromatiales bacterium]|jgi:arginine decarboxylase
MWSIADARRTYSLASWGEGYFGINPQGHMIARPLRDAGPEVDLYRLASEVREAGLAWPVLVRFNDILHDRVRALCGAFAQAFERTGYGGRYTAVYPIKVNQQHSVVEHVLAGGGDCVGLEAGSKPELMAVLAQAPAGGVIVCNGYKDREYIRLALIGQRLGHRVYIVIEKLNELDAVLREAESLQVRPLIGVRVRLAASAAGNWQNSGGERAKFGLSAGQVLTLVDRLRRARRLDCLELLHSHLGSQIPNLRDIAGAMDEVARFFAELEALGARIRVVDVGGGLGVDYEGTATRHYCSINYSLERYARAVVDALKGICAERGLREPDIITESGRAMTAHHAVLVAEVVECEAAPGDGVPEAPAEEAPPVLRSLARALDSVPSASPLEIYREAAQDLEDAREGFRRGDLDLRQRAWAEELFYSVCRRLRPRLSAASRSHRALLDELNERLADKVFCNFSVFQSMPDVWAIDQIFPVAPLQRLDEAPGRSGVIQDLTCDSDGCIEHYVDENGVERTLPLHDLRPGEPYLLGFFLVGAYQEILGDMHNLFGDTDSINVELDGEGGYRLTRPERGDSADELLGYVHFDPRDMLASFRRKLGATDLAETDRERYFEELEAGLYGYTYLED